MVYRYSLGFLIGLLLMSGAASAQLVTGNMFLQGRYLEIGSMPNGCLGSSVATPAGYHPHNAGSVFLCSTSSPNLLASVYDWGHDGWTTGTPAYMGDYTLPGSPWEGWGVEVGGVSSYANATACGFTGSLVGNWTSYSNVGGRAIGVWTGSVSGGNLSIRQEYRIDTLSSSVIMTVKFKNVGAAPLANVYYYRSCDPDNDESWGGSFSTNNVIDFQNDYYHRVQVTATAPSSTNYTLGLSTKDCRAKAIIYTSWPLSTSVDLAALWSGSAAYTGTEYQDVNAHHDGDIAIGLVYKIGTLAPGDTALISFAYVYNGIYGVDSAFPEPKLVVNGTTYDSIGSVTTCSSLNCTIINGSDKTWTNGVWTWAPATGLSATTGVTSVCNPAALATTTTYTITGYDSSMGSCENKTFFLTVTPVPVVPPTTTDETLCQGVVASPLTATGTGLLWYTTATGGVGSAIAPTPSTATVGTTTYWVSQTLGAGCESARVPIHVTIQAPPVISVSDNGPLCPGDDLHFTVTSSITGGGVTYSWTGPAGFTSALLSPIITGVVFADSGVYTLSINNLGCVSTATDAVMIHSTPPMPVHPNPTYCQGVTAAQLTATGSNLLWYTTPTGGVGSAIAPTPSTTTPGTITYYVSQTVNGCTSPRSPVIVTVNALPAAPLIVDNPGSYCPGTAWNTFTIVTGTNILWYAAATGGTGVTATPVVNTNNPGTYTFWATQTVLACEGPRSSVTVTVFDSVRAHFSYTPHFGCTNDTVLFTNNSYDASNYVWSFGDGYSSIAADPTHIYAHQGTYTVKLIAHSNSCIDSNVQNVSLIHPDSAAFTFSPGIVCQGAPVYFRDTSNALMPTYMWDFGDGSGSIGKDPFHRYQLSGLYHVKLIVTNSVPCSDTAYGTIQVDTNSVLTFTASDTLFCRGTYVTFDANYATLGNSSLTWDFGNGDSILNVNPVSYAFPAVGTYTVTASARYRACPTAQATKVIRVNQTPNIYLGPDTTICGGSTYLLLGDMLNYGNPDAHWHWNTSDAGYSIQVGHPGLYIATVTIGGCSASDSIRISDDCEVAICNVFSPNGDGINDYFNPRDYFSRGLNSFSMNIYNRWGQLVFQTSSLDGRGWDGMLNSVPQPEGVYIYVINATFVDGKKLSRQGNLTLIK